MAIACLLRRWLNSVCRKINLQMGANETQQQRFERPDLRQLAENGESW